MTTSALRALRVALAIYPLAGASVAQGPAIAGATCQRGAGMESLGLATAGTEGLLELAVEGAPVVGLPFRLKVRNGVPDGLGVAVFGAKVSPLFVPAFGVTVFPSSPFLFEIPFTLDAEGVSPPLFEQTPVDPALCGTAYVAQASATDAAAMGGASFTKAVGFRFGTGSGDVLFGPGSPGFPLTTNTVHSTAGDLNGDQHLDLAFAALTEDGVDEAVVVLFGAGDGTFSPKQVLPTVNPYPGKVSVGDVDGDGANDLVTAAGNQFNPSSGMAILPSDGAGGFLPASMVTDPYATHVKVADMNADGQPDLVCARAEKNNVQTWLGTGGGAFLPPGTFPVDVGPIAVTVADMDQDGVLDVATANRELDGWLTPASVSVLMGLGDGTFGPHQTLLTETPDLELNVAIRIESADFALDGLVDLVALVVHGGSSGGSVCVFTGQGGTFSAAANYLPGGNPHDMRIADVDRDFHPDVILATASVADEGIRVLRGASDGKLLPYVAYALGFDANTLASGDFDGDFLPDVVVTTGMGDDAFLFRNQLLP